MLRDLLRLLTGNGTGAAQAAASGEAKPEKQESPLSPIIEQWRQAGSSAGSIARQAAGLTGNRSLEGAAAGATTAVTGAGLAVAGAATGNLFLAGAGLSSLVQGSMEAGKSLVGFSKEVVEGNRRLGQYNGQIAFANAQLDIGRQRREIELARSTAATASRASRAEDLAEAAWAPFMRFFEANKNRLSADFSELTAKSLMGWRLAFKRAFGIDIDDITKELELEAGGVRKAPPVLQVLREIAAEGERRRLLSEAERRREAERTRRELTRPKPSLDPPEKR